MRNHIEDDHQANFFTWLAMTYPTIREIAFAIPNGGFRHSREAARLKAQGVLKGVPDIFIALPITIKIQTGEYIFQYKHYHGVFIEMKAPIVAGKPKPVVSKSQKERIALLEKAGYFCPIAYGWLEAKQYLEWYVKGKGYERFEHKQDGCTIGASKELHP